MPFEVLKNNLKIMQVIKTTDVFPKEDRMNLSKIDHRYVATGTGEGKPTYACYVNLEHYDKALSMLGICEKQIRELEYKLSFLEHDLQQLNLNNYHKS
jgi:hypothetical protein